MMVTIVPYKPSWPGEFHELADLLRGSLGDLALRIDHIGSTAVPGLAAKDRIDIQVEVPRLSYEEINGEKGERSETVRKRVLKTRNIQIQRNNTLNSQLDNKLIDDVCELNKPDHALLKQAIDKLQLSARSYHRILKLARTIADMQASDNINKTHLSEAITYRGLDRARLS